MEMRPDEHEYLQTVARPVSALAKDHAGGYIGFMHANSRAQFLYPASGSMKVTFDSGCWIVPPQRAVWLPPGCLHRTGSIGPVQIRTLYIRTDACPFEAPGVARMIGVSALLRELILRVMDMPVEYDEKGQDARIIAALLGEIKWAAINPVGLPKLHDRRLQSMEEILLRTPNDRSTLDQWAKRLGVSRRTLNRLLQREAHLSFQAWRDQICAFSALPLMAEGRPLTEIASTVGYETAWSFTAMFKRVTGIAPSRYFSMEGNV
jgi:AraC-like DNA-binding protein/mannose-6-phosphate isomerase-like protein (cupin superfamily)